MGGERTAQPWWKESVVYQIYPRSFQDSDGDGVGDLRGILSRLDHLADLGVDVVWLGPVFDSPFDDNGYDIRDYRAVAEVFGTLDDWDEMLAGMHERGIRLVMDLVVNHTSDEHPWFEASRASKENPYRDFYLWRTPGPDGREPTNWASLFGGSAWAFDEATGEYYLHLFSRRQPDLNWENPDVREAVYEMMEWWLDRGVDGFRLDAINLIAKPPGLPDAPVVTPHRYQFPGEQIYNGARMQAFLREMKERVLAGRDVLTVGEAYLATTEHAVGLTHETSGALSMVFQFEHLEIDKDPASPNPRWSRTPWSLVDLKRVLSRWQDALEGRGWNSNYLTNHDLPRALSRFGDAGEHRHASATLLATLVHLLKGTPYIYQGEEIGMTDVAFDSIDDYRDIETLAMYREYVEERGVEPEAVLAMIHAKSRDNARSPMQWDDSAHAGFTTGTPWMRVNPNYREINVARERADPDSILAYYRRLIRLRRERPVVVHGRYDLLLPDHETIYAFTRTLDDERLLCVLNVSGEETRFAPPAEVGGAGATLLLANREVDPADEVGAFVGAFTLRPFEARVYRLG